MVRDPYQVLGVPHDADEETIKQAYRRLAKQYHPDLHPGDEYAAKRMNEINEAYDAIKNPQAYRQQQQQQTWTGRSSTYSDPFDGFNPWQHSQQQEQQEPEGSYSWTFYRPHRGFGCLVRIILAFFIIQLFFSLFSGCARILFLPFTGVNTQPNSSYSDSYQPPTGQGNRFS